MNVNMTDKVALVTGAGSGIGRATAEAFAAAGAAVVVSDVDTDGNAETVAAVEAAGGTATAVSCDVANEDEVRALVETAVSTYGGLDYACNNAGIEGHPAPVHEMEAAEFRRVIDVNLMGVFFGMKYQVPAMLERGGGAIINISSTAGLRGYPAMTPYVSSKHAVTGITKAVALEVATSGIRVLSVHPAAIETPMITRAVAENPDLGEALEQMHPVGRAGLPREVADVVVFLCSDGASFMTGSQVVVDGGALSHG